MSRFAIAISLCILALALIGCSGGDDGDDGGQMGPVPSADNARVTGTVVRGDSVGSPVSRVTVSEASTRQSTVTATDGSFTLTGLPAGTVYLSVGAPSSGNYQGARVPTATRAGSTTQTTIALLPLTTGTPTQLAINPAGSATVEQGGILKFSASVYVGGSKVNVQPTWVLSSPTADVGANSMLADGTLQTGTAGSFLVTGVVGNLTHSSGVVVTPALPPQIGSVLVSHSNDNPIPASGGIVTITAAITDGNGIQTNDAGALRALRFELQTPRSGVISLPTAAELPFLPIAQTTIYDGTWRYNYAVPANNNAPTADGLQAHQQYLVRVVARDTTGAESTSDWYEFRVAGLDTPPPLPE